MTSARLMGAIQKILCLQIFDQAVSNAVYIPRQRQLPDSTISTTTRLGREDSNLRITAPKAAAFPLGDAPTYYIVTYSITIGSFSQAEYKAGSVGAIAPTLYGAVPSGPHTRTQLR